MSVLLKTSVKRAFAESFLSDITSNRAQYFLFISKTTPWSSTAGASADIIPVLPPDTVESEYDIMRSIIGYKKIDPSKIVFALPKISWEAGTVYDEYRDDANLFDPDSPSSFYVVTTSNNIYKCLGATSATSTVMPTHTSSLPLKGTDGYTWKYLATVKSSELPYELIDYVPINFLKIEQDGLVDPITSETTLQFNAQKSAINGEITKLELLSNGGASAAEYIGSEYGARFVVGPTGSTAANVSYGVGDFYTITSSTFTNQFSLPQSLIDSYKGYILRVVGVSGGSITDVNKYGIIYGVTASSSQYTFTIRGEYEPFVLNTTSVNDRVYYDILPHVRISGDGSNAYGFLTLGKTAETSWRKVTGVELINGGSDYSQTSVEIVSDKPQNTVHPTINAVVSPKGGHGSNILKELNISDVIMIANIDDTNDSSIIPTDGSYRQFGIIRNPVLNDGSELIAGKTQQYYRNLILLYLGGNSTTLQQFTSNFFSGTKNYIIGSETYASFPVVSATSVSTLNNETRVQVKVKNTGSEPITWADRLDVYDLNLSTPKSGFVDGEKITQYIPVGISAFGGISYAFGVTAEGTIISSTTNRLNVRVNKNSFASGNSQTLKITGSFSGTTAYVAGVSLAYGEFAWVNVGLSLATEGGNTAELFKIISASVPYFDEATVPKYTGLTVLGLNKLTGSVVPDFTETTWANGDFIQQGKSGSYDYDYASATVYKWDKINSTSGNLYISEPFGKFKTVSDQGATFSRLNYNSINDGYSVGSITNPQIDIHSGEIIYINSIQPIQRLRNQSEEFRLRVGF
ncbi:MAG: hypothetical protein EB127_06130 [Alphaproteobacteria bacterium]|nr:hypothetical protein [Alphaproteobacteria bacterium]